MDFDTSREWLVTNGNGSYASSTVSGCNTRRYHALLCAATAPPLGRMVLVNKADETLTVGDRAFELGCNQYPGAVHPAGYQFLQSFEASPLPLWTYAVPGATLLKTLWMPHGENRTIVRYELTEGESATLAIHPFVTGRDYHGIHRFNTEFDRAVNYEHGEISTVRLQPYSNCPPIVWTHGGEFRESGAWYYSFEYAVEAQRGLDYVEDAYCPGAWVWQLTRENPVALWAIANEPTDMAAAEASRHNEFERLAGLRRPFEDGADCNQARSFALRLAPGADQFIVRRGDGLHTVLAGYPWFTDWGRDTTIALPGLCLSTGRFDIAKSILLAFAGVMSQGMIPNRFPDAGDTPEYNTVDATLWFFHAAGQYVAQSGDAAILDKLYEPLCDSIDWHLRGTRYGIAADASDGMLRSGEAGTQLTWMDAKVGDWVVTPRHGKPVEIQALWYNALRVMGELAERRGDDATKKLCAGWCRKIKASFSASFWNEGAGMLYDCIDGDNRDGSLRPNQIFVLSLPHRLLSLDIEKQVLETVRRELLTPYGLRSLAQGDPQYNGIYVGDQLHRDGSYHQGTVWAWLIGPFLSAYLRINRNSKAARAQALEWLRPLRGHLDAAGLDSISEIFDGDAPHTPRGCYAQAWSVAEVLRVLVELDKPA